MLARLEVRRCFSVYQIDLDLILYPFSYLLSRRGMAQRIGNLVGRLKFSDDQLQQTQKGLNDAGVSMPNFKSVSRELAKEINEEPEEEIETDDER